MVLPVPTEFVRVSADGRRFEVNGCPWYFAGCNWYAFSRLNQVPEISNFQNLWPFPAFPVGQTVSTFQRKHAQHSLAQNVRILSAMEVPWYTKPGTTLS